MAPEITLEDHYDNKVDVFSFGIVLTEMITNKPPKKRPIEKNLEFDAQIFIDSIPDDCPEILGQLVLQCTQFEPQKRPHFREIVTKLRNAMKEFEEEDD